LTKQPFFVVKKNEHLISLTGVMINLDYEDDIKFLSRRECHLSYYS